MKKTLSKMNPINPIKYLSYGILLYFILFSINDLEAKKYPKSIIYETIPSGTNLTKYMQNGNFLSKTNTDLRLNENAVKSSLHLSNAKKPLKKRHKNCNPKFLKICQWQRYRKSTKLSIQR